ncbi:MAG: hypothetical protein H0W64_07625 [Gammaproteobacteria bacterium]|nr:hypothetical protein [Gammaproteobacteria bacterium]
MNAAWILYQFKSALGHSAQKNAFDIVNLAIESNAFMGRRHHFRFYKNETNLDKIIDLKKYLLNHEQHLNKIETENENAKLRFYSNS